MQYLNTSAIHVDKKKSTFGTIISQVFFYAYSSRRNTAGDTTKVAGISGIVFFICIGMFGQCDCVHNIHLLWCVERIQEYFAAHYRGIGIVVVCVFFVSVVRTFLSTLDVGSDGGRTDPSVGPASEPIVS